MLSVSGMKFPLMQSPEYRLISVVSTILHDPVTKLSLLIAFAVTFSDTATSPVIVTE